MDFQCTHTMGGPAPSLHRESTDSLILTLEYSKKGIGVVTKAIVLLTNAFIIVPNLRNCVHILPHVLHNHIVPLWWCTQPIISDDKIM